MFDKNQLLKSNTFNPARIVFLSFLLIILAGGFLLYLPFSQGKNSQITYIDSLYTATSAVCVTGLIVKDTPNDFSYAGQTVIMCLIQIGGLGIMTFSLLFLSLFSNKLSVKSNILASQITGSERLENIRALVRYVILFTFGTELLGAIILFVKFINLLPIKKALFYSVFHSVSAFCNAGFALYTSNLMDFKTDFCINITIMSLIVIGGIGFVVVYELHNYFSNRKKTKQKIKISLHSRLTLITTGFLIIIGTGLIYMFEFNNSTFYNLDFADKLLAALFQSITARTAGFNTLNIAEMTDCSLIVIIVLMFIGGSPSSTAGGIKTTTFAVLMLTLVSMISDKDNVEIYGKRIQKSIIHKTIVITTLSVIIIIFVTLLTLYVEQNNLGQNKFLKVLFESVSAFGTVGLSMDLSPKLSNLSKIVYIILMFIGRIGAITFAIAFVSKKKKIHYTLPEDKVIIG